MNNIYKQFIIDTGQGLRFAAWDRHRKIAKRELRKQKKLEGKK